MTIAVTRISTDANGVEGNNDSSNPVFSPDGTKVAFSSTASNLVTGDLNSAGDIFVKTLATGAITLVSTGAGGVQGNALSLSPVFSPDGTQVAFVSAASNLVPGDTNSAFDIFVKTLATGAITLISADAFGVQGNGPSSNLVFSPDGTKVAFASDATNLVAGDTNATTDIFVKTLAGGAITRISTDAGGVQGNRSSSNPVFSPDGTKVAFASDARNLIPGDNNFSVDIFVKDLVSGVITRISTDAVGGEANNASSNPVFSPDGTQVLFASDATNLVPGDTNGATDIFVKTLATGVITRISTDAGGLEGNNASSNPVFSPDGTKVLFTSAARNLVPGDTNNAQDVFVKTLATGAITRISTDAAGVQGGAVSQTPVFSPDGTQVAYVSGANNLVVGDTNGVRDVFVVTLNVNVPPGPRPDPAPSSSPSASAALPIQFSNLSRIDPAATDVVKPTITGVDGKPIANPLYVQAQAAAAIQAQYDAGKIYVQDAQLALYHLVDGTVSVGVTTYAFFTGTTPSAAGLNYLTHSPGNAADFNDPYFAQFTTENRFINQAVALGTGQGAGAARFAAAYGPLSLADAAAKAYAEVFGFAPAAGKIDAILNGVVSNGLGGTETRAQYLADITGGSAIAQKAAVVGFFLADSFVEGGAYQRADYNFLADLAHGTAAYGIDLLAGYGRPVQLTGQAVLDPLVPH